MRLLIVGNGGREHTLAWSLAQSPQVEAVICTPGNGGTAGLEKCCNRAIAVDDFPGLVDLCHQESVDLVVVGPEVPLVLGLTDVLRDQGIAVFGPSQAGAQIEGSKAWAKDFMAAAGIPTARSATFTEASTAQAYVRQQGAPIVVKADGLAAGKGVTVAATVAEAEAAIADALGGKFGAAGQCLVIEDCLQGAEASVLALCDGQTIVPLVPAQDHKRIGEGDTGSNTGGMGAYAPAPLVTPAILQRIETEVLQPALQEFQRRGIDYRGILYAGLMISPDGNLGVIEFNCRFGDPETQVVLPLLDTPLLDLLLACCEGRLDQVPLVWKPGVAACVVAAAGGYPGSYGKGHPITGLESAQIQGAMVFQAGTQTTPTGAVVTDGGRVLGVTAVGADFDRAFADAYAALDLIQFEGMYCRRDIGYQVRS
ncbi:phosphoribosylamine--glycine ligase [Prochlorothrix hollandica]|uniref:phosphoribosylamine--glycine ligase n=1 Tax=Prochlorothrix hollandica TaxID=1223 RepID=UPI00333F334A